MSRIGKKPVIIPEGVQVDVKDEDRLVIVKGPKGQLEYKRPEGVIVKKDENKILVNISDDIYKNLW
jgi:large subunit ribosomal protein L6